MATTASKDIHKLKLQLEVLSLTIQAAGDGPKRFPAGAVIMRKGKRVGVGGEIMPKDPPAFQIEKYPGELTGEKKKPSQLEIERMGDEDFVDPKEDKNAVKTFLANAKTVVNKVQDELGKAFDAIKNMTAEQFMKIWTNPFVVKIRSQFSEAMGSVGASAKKAYTDVMKTFTDTVSNINSSIKSKVGEASAFISDLQKQISGMFNGAIKKISDASGNTQAMIAQGVGVAIGAINGMIGSLAAGGQSVMNISFIKDAIANLKSLWGQVSGASKELIAQFNAAMKAAIEAITHEEENAKKAEEGREKIRKMFDDFKKENEEGEKKRKQEQEAILKEFEEKIRLAEEARAKKDKEGEKATKGTVKRIEFLEEALKKAEEAKEVES
jgi:hypothetical protein